jgi:hypothetical protein
VATGQDRPGLLIGFIGAQSARTLGRMSPAEQQEIVVGECVKRFGPKAAERSQSIVYPPTGLSYFNHNRCTHSPFR